MASGETRLAPAPHSDGHRLIVRRTNLHDPRGALFPTYRNHAILTDCGGEVIAIDTDNRRRAVVDFAIRELNGGSRYDNCPLGDFSANAAWDVLASITHKLVLGPSTRSRDPRSADRPDHPRKFPSLPGRITHGTRQRRLHLPSNWPGAVQWSSCFERLTKLQS